MPRNPTPKTGNDHDLLNIAFAIYHLQSAYDYLTQTQAFRTAHETRRALKSAEDARRLARGGTNASRAEVPIEDCRFTLTLKGLKALKDAAQP